jgi:hypothetical protein
MLSTAIAARLAGMPGRIVPLAGPYLGSVVLLAPGAAGAPAASRALSGPGAVRGPRPVLVMLAPDQDSGTVMEGTVLQYRFIIANRGDAVLEVTQVKNIGRSRKQNPG